MTAQGGADDQTQGATLMFGSLLKIGDKPAWAALARCSAEAGKAVAEDCLSLGSKIFGGNDDDPWGILGSPLAGNVIGAVGMELLKPDADDRLKEREAELRMERDLVRENYASTSAQPRRFQRLDASQPRDRAVQKLCPVAASKSYSKCDSCSAPDRAVAWTMILRRMARVWGLLLDRELQPSSQPDCAATGSDASEHGDASTRTGSSSTQALRHSGIRRIVSDACEADSGIDARTEARSCYRTGGVGHG